HVSDPPEHFIAVEENDAFAAARLLLPRFRGFLADSLGEPFCAAIPNRDFLICWPAGAAPEFHEAIEAKVAEDYETQPYPLTRAVFVATRTSLAEIPP
ncbi:MAG TPA: hypothetical protein VHK90_17810, partial [Thermoanaerobaculia bacterium]|nr:hypothetical protein [Thermoanaerobaculia bacterium]